MWSSYYRRAIEAYRERLEKKAVVWCMQTKAGASPEQTSVKKLQLRPKQEGSQESGSTFRGHEQQK